MKAMVLRLRDPPRVRSFCPWWVLGKEYPDGQLCFILFYFFCKWIQDRSCFTPPRKSLPFPPLLFPTRHPAHSNSTNCPPPPKNNPKEIAVGSGGDWRFYLWVKSEFTKKEKCVSYVFAPDVPTGASGPTEACRKPSSESLNRMRIFIEEFYAF